MERVRRVVEDGVENTGGDSTLENYHSELGEGGTEGKVTYHQSTYGIMISCRT